MRKRKGGREGGRERKREGWGNGIWNTIINQTYICLQVFTFAKIFFREISQLFKSKGTINNVC